MSAIRKYRPRSMAEIRELPEFTTDQAYENGLAFQPWPTDVIISPYAKSGTTWTQQIVHTLRSGGDMAFDDISRVVPWLEVSSDFGIDLDAPQTWQPRAFKSHLTWHNVPKGARYIVPIRDPRDVLVSLYRFNEGWIFETGYVTMADYAVNFLNPTPGHGYWHHLLSWWPQRYRPDLLLLAYESMQADPAGAIQKIAAFCGIPLDEELLQLTLTNSSFEFMLRHKDRFDDKLMRERSETVLGLPPGSDSAKVRRGQVGSHAYELSAEILIRLEELWQQEIQGRLGFPSYEALRQEVDRDGFTSS